MVDYRKIVCLVSGQLVTGDLG